ncbi:MAG: bifunctional phosphoribosylaminoimidazolecarboxamide formyltransferase/IMP cyclohydrolase [Verrucomicrobiota bacterium]
MAAERALLSVSDKSGLLEFARRLHDKGLALLSTGGTARYLRESGLPVIDVSEHTGFPELFEGRVKTLHPKVHGGLLYRRGSEEHVRQAKEHDVPPIDLLVVNLYPFEETVARPDVTLDEAIEQIDIGGPALLRGASKNHESVAVVTDPADYEVVAGEIEATGDTTFETRQRLAIKAYEKTAAYDLAISAHLRKATGQTEGAGYTLSQSPATPLRYGDNPHQRATLYGDFDRYFKKLQGKDLSYTNVLDIGGAAELIHEFDQPTVAILKHTNPCGVGTDSDDLVAAWDKAFATDRQAPFGGVVICNRPMTEALALTIKEIFTDVIIAPGFEESALAVFRKKKNLRLMHMSDEVVSLHGDPVIRSAPAGFLVRDSEAGALGLDQLDEKVRTKRPPTEAEVEAMIFGWKVVKHVKSNAIVFAGRDRTLGIGAGQMSRVDSCRIAVWKAGEAGLSLDGSAVASDAMFPFADGLVAAAEAGATAAVQPGGSIRDEEVIAAADERSVAMVFTGHRHFKH